MDRGITIALFGDSGSGKTTQAGEYAKFVRKQRGKNTLLHTSDPGGFDSLGPLVRARVVLPIELLPTDDPWIWLDEAIGGTHLTDEIGLVVIDSGTSIAEALMIAARNSTFQIGQQPVQKFALTKGKDKNLTVAVNSKAHYGVVQGFMLEAMRKSTWLTHRGVDVLWTFSLHRGEEQDNTPLLGLKVVGNALTPVLPKEFKYTLRTEAIPQENAAPLHRLYLTEYPDRSGLGHSSGNARIPFGQEIPPYVEPASIQEALRIFQEAQDKADEDLKVELGL